MTIEMATYVTIASALIMAMAIFGNRFNISRKERGWGWNHPHSIGVIGSEAFREFLKEQGHHIRRRDGFGRILVESVAQSLRGYEHYSLEERRKWLKRQADLIIKSRWNDTGSGGMFDQWRIERVVERCHRLNDSSDEMMALLQTLERIDITAGKHWDTVGQRQLALTYAYVSATILHDTEALKLTRSGRDYIGLDEIRTWARS